MVQSQGDFQDGEMGGLQRVSHDLQTDLLDKMKLLDASVASLHSLGTKAAEKEKDYRIIYAKSLLILRADGLPVSLIEGVAKGREEVATAKLEWDIAVSKYESAREFSLAVKKELEILNAIIAREWGHG